MKTKSGNQTWWRESRRLSKLVETIHPLVALAAALAAATLLLPSAAWAGGVVTNCTEPALRAAMAGGGVVTFACDGTILLSNTIANMSDTTLDGSGRQVTISGSKAVRVFYNNTNVSFTVVNMIIANGASSNGAAIFNAGGTLVLLSTAFLTNVASGALIGGQLVNGEGGAVFNQAGAVSGVNCSFIGNCAQQTTNSADWFSDGSKGGAVFNANGQVNLSNCVFQNNWTSGAPGFFNPPLQLGPPAFSTPGLGGAIHNAGMLNATLCTFLCNSASGGAGAAAPMPDGYCSIDVKTGGDGNGGMGGAICNFGVMNISASAFYGNTASGGAGGMGGPGPACSYGIEGAPGGGGGSGNGAALFNRGTAWLANCTVATNICIGGNGGTGGTGGWAMSSDLPGGRGGRGGAGGSGSGSLYDTTGNLLSTNCTIALNQSIPGGAGAGGAGGLGHPGTGGDGPPGSPGSSGSAFGGLTSVGSTMINTILASNWPGGNCVGSIRDAGHNLSSDGSCAFTNVGSMNNADPKLGPLANNGGLSLTMALLPGSPAIDAGNTSAAPWTDQRGFPRPAGLAADIGAFEYGSVMPAIAVSRSGATGLNIMGSGNAGQPCRLLSSPDLTSWASIATDQIGSDGTVVFHATCVSGGACRFYRLVMP